MLIKLVLLEFIILPNKKQVVETALDIVIFAVERQALEVDEVP